MESTQNTPKTTPSLPTGAGVPTEGLEVTNTVEKINEMVPEVPAEAGKTTQKTKKQKEKIKEAQLLKAKKKKAVKIPSPKVQKRQTQRAIQAEIKQLKKNAFWMRVKMQFDSVKMEKIVQRVRFLQHILAELAKAAKERVLELYTQFVVNKKMA